MMAAFSNSGFYKKLGKAGAALVVAASVAAVPVIKKWEGRSLTPYYDIAGVLTYCDGETLNARHGTQYTHEQCDALTQKRALEFAEGVAASLERPVSQKTFESLIVFSYNVGLGNFRSSTALRRINDGRTAEGCEAMMKFVCVTVAPGKGETAQGKPCYSTLKNKKFVQGLWNRRDEERQMCLAGIADDTISSKFP